MQGDSPCVQNHCSRWGSSSALPVIRMRVCARREQSLFTTIQINASNHYLRRLKFSEKYFRFIQLQFNVCTLTKGVISIIHPDLMPADLGICLESMSDQSTGIVQSAFDNAETGCDPNPGVFVLNGAASTAGHINDQILGRDLTNAMTTMDEYLAPPQKYEQLGSGLLPSWRWSIAFNDAHNGSNGCLRFWSTIRL